MRLRLASNSSLLRRMSRRSSTYCLYAATFSALLLLAVLVYQEDLMTIVREYSTNPSPIPKCSADNQLEPCIPAVDVFPPELGAVEGLVMLDVEEEEKPQGTQKIMWDPGFNGIPQDDPDLIAYIREFLLEPPAGHYNLDEPHLADFSEFEQSIKVDQILHQMSGGFFLEAGAADGEVYSNTLFAERERGWRGVLVEPDPDTYRQMRTKGRNAHTINTCLALKPTPHMSYFQRDKLDEGRLSDTKTELQLQCLPLYSILLALNVTTVDYLSLDLVGYELQVLQTVPWDKIRAMIISVDAYHIDSYPTVENYMVAQGYVALNSDTDFLFAHPQLMIETLNNIITGRRH